MSPSKPKNTAALSQLGNLYQYLTALKVCLDSQEGSLVYIEVVGDIQTSDYNFEIKHHIDPKHHLSATHIDFWKSLANWVENRQILQSHKKFVLLTTSIVKNGSLFSNWNEMSVDEKLKRLEKIRASIEKSPRSYSTISPHLKTVFNFDSEYHRSDLIDVLEKVVIKHSEQQALLLYKNLCNHSALIAAPRNQTEILVQSLLGYIVSLGLKNITNWTIEVSEFFDKLRIEVGKLHRNEILSLPLLEGIESVDPSVMERRFIQKIRDISYDEKIDLAAKNYTMYQSTMVKMSEQNPHVLGEFQSQVDDAGRQLDNLKSIECLNISEPENTNLISKSKVLYTKADQNIVTGRGTNPPEIQSGIIHTNVDETDFEWKIKEEDCES